ncbi:redoxin domain-containing protein [Marinifilum sp.]|uniref:redoxin domain-containing protein n=1 Tax=Marinifilum sp. TaxID=2033137 RepID=UPI003BAB82D2
MKLKIISLCLLIFSLFTCAKLNAQKYNISIQLLNCSDSTAYLAHYFDGRIFADDTTQLINGKGVFSKDKILDQGIYVIYLPSQKYFDLLIGEDQEFAVTADPNDFIESIAISGSKESIGFHDFQTFMKSQNEKSRKLQEAFKKTSKESDKEKYKKEFKNADVEVREYIGSLKAKFPENSFVPKFAQFTLSPKIPDFKSELPKNTPDREKVIQQKSYLYNKNHYFDHVDFADSRYLRTPILKKKLDLFFEKILVQSPDTIVKESVQLIEQARPDSIFFQYLTQYALNYAVKSKVMGMDAAFVNLAKKYYLSGQANWADSTLMANIRERVIKTQFNLLGMKAQDLLMQTLEGEYVRLHEVEANYTVLYFWEPDCGHCKKATPRLKKEILDHYSDKGLKVFAVCTQDQKEMWENAIHDYDIYDFINCYDPDYQTNFRIFYDVFTTPIIYLLDKDKNIIAKRLDIDNLKIFLDNDLKKHNQDKGTI